MNWKLHLAWPLCVAVSLADARSKTMSLVETVYYDFEFATPYSGILVEERWHEDGTNYDLVARDQRTSSSDATIFHFGFWHYGSEPLSFGRETLNFFPLSGLSAQMNDSYSSVDWGYVTFEDDNTITEWNASAEISWEGFSFHSDPVPIDAEFVTLHDYIEDMDQFLGAQVYGRQSFGAEEFFFTEPGRWSTSVQRHCYYAAEDGGYAGDAECPRLIPPDNGCGPSGGVPPKCDPLALVPLPPSLLLLASGLAGVGLLRRRKRLTA